VTTGRYFTERVVDVEILGDVAGEVEYVGVD